jgi:hypothetical protein
MPRGFTRIVMPVFSKFYTETVIGASVQAGNEAFNYLTGNKVNLIQISPFFYLSKVFRNRDPNPISKWHRSC